MRKVRHRVLIVAGVLFTLGIGPGLMRARSDDEPSALAVHSGRLLQLLPGQTEAVIGLRANPRGCMDFFGCFAKEILFAADWADRLHPFEPVIQSAAINDGVLLASLDSPDSEDGWVAMIPSAAQEGWLQALQEAGFSNSTQPDGSVWMKLDTQQGASLLAVAQPDLFLMGDAWAVRRCIEQQGSAGSGLSADADFRQRVTELAQSHLWGVARRQWLEGDLSSPEVASLPRGFLLKNLSGVRLVDFSARTDFEAAFHMRSEVQNEEQASILADELNEFIAQAAPADAPEEIRQMMQKAQVSSQGNSVELSMLISSKALSKIHQNQASRAILRWDLAAAERERNQRIKDLFKWMDVKPGSQVADIGAGGGFTAVRLARLIGSQGEVFAVEIQPDLVDALKRRSERSRTPQLQAVLGDEGNPNLPVNALDAVLIVNAYHEMGRYQDMLRHIRNSLRADGRLVITEPYAAAHSGDSRAAQTEKHQIAPHFVEQELNQAGFRILYRQDDFIARDHDGHKHSEWLIVAVRSKQALVPGSGVD